MAKVPPTQAELEAYLADQIAMLKASADGFDRGDIFEYRRLALAVRILVHDTKMSHSLLGQLGRKGIGFVDTSDAFQPGNELTESLLTVTVAGGARSGFKAPLDKADSRNHLPFEAWWNAEVLKDSNENRFARRDFILEAANTDGGAHVGDLKESYADLLRRETTGWWRETSDGVEPLGQLERAIIRQIAHEMLLTLDPSYAKAPEYTGSVTTRTFSQGSPDGSRDVLFFGDGDTFISSGPGQIPQWMKDAIKQDRSARGSVKTEGSGLSGDALNAAAFGKPIGRRARRRNGSVHRQSKF